MRDLQERAPKDTKAKIQLLGKYDSHNKIIIRDPYFVNIFNSVIIMIIINLLYIGPWH